jgi:DNA-binding transcriptional LysR family regulator
MFEPLFAERGLSLDRLKVLVEVHDAGSIAQAAPGDPIRQSQYSRQLRELAEFFGCEVAQRQGKLLKLTPQGVKLAELGREQLRSLQDFRAECRAESVDYTIAAGDSLLQWLVIPRLSRLSKGKQATRFSTVNLRTNEIVQQLIEGRIDFGVTRRDAVADGLKVAPLGELSYVVVVPRALVSSVQQLTLPEILSKMPLAAQTTDGQFAQRLRDVAQKCGIDFSPALACQSFPHALSAVRSGAFAAILPRLALGELPPEMVTIVDSDLLQPLSRPLALAWNPRVTAVRPRAAQLATELKKVLQLE